MPFVKGQSGNPRGRPRDGTSWVQVLEKIGAEKISANDDLTKKEAVARRLWSEAAKGQSWAIMALMDRMDGKPKQEVQQDITSGGKEIKTITREVVDPKHSNA